MANDRYWEQWDQVATSMDEFWASEPVEGWFRKTLAGVLQPWVRNGTPSYLDVGCGSGLLFQEFLAAGAKTTSMVGIDNSPKMIELAKKRVPEATFGIGDLFGLAYPDESVETVGCISLLSHIPDMKAGLKEMWRVASRAIFFTVFIGEQASTLNDFWGTAKFTRSTFTVEQIREIVKEVCGPRAILIKARHFLNQRTILFGVFKPGPASAQQALHSVILGSYNRPKLVKRAIRSVLAQTVSDWQLIIADDGSSDDTIRSIHEEIAGDSRVVFNPCRDPLDKEVRVGCSNRACQRINDAIPLVRGKYVHYLADDDWYDPARFAVFNKIFSDSSVYCAYGRVILMNRDKIHGAVFPKSPCQVPLSNLDYSQIAHRAETFQVVKEWPVQESGDHAFEGRYFDALAGHWPFIGLNEVVAYKMFHPFNMRVTRDQSTSVREL